MKTCFCYLTLSLIFLPAFNRLCAQDDLVNGREYHRYNIFFTRGLPYFKTDSLTAGSLEFDGKKYENVPLLYDQVMDELVISNYDGTKFVRLVRPRVQQFSLLGSLFINLKEVDKNLHDGYYEVLYDGTIKVYKKDKKEISDDARLGQDVHKIITGTVTYYLKNNGKYSSVRSVSSLIAAINDKVGELKQFQKKNRKKYRVAGVDKALAEVAAYYDQLTR